MPCNCKKTETVPSNICEVKKKTQKKMFYLSQLLHTQISPLSSFSKARMIKKITKKVFEPPKLLIFLLPYNSQKISKTLYSLLKKPRRIKKEIFKIICGMLWLDFKLYLLQGKYKRKSDSKLCTISFFEFGALATFAQWERVSLRVHQSKRVC